jgi:hypothetical protein
MILLRSGVVLLIIFFAPLAMRKVNRVASDSFRLTGWTGQSTVQAWAQGALIRQKKKCRRFPEVKSPGGWGPRVAALMVLVLGTET